MGIRGALAILVLAAVAAPAAFSGEPPATVKESKPPAPNPPTADRLPPTDFAIRLTIADCVLAAVRNNIDLRRARLADQQAELDRRSALAEFLPTLSTSGNRSHLQDKRGPESDATDGSVAVTQKTPLGTTITGRASQSHADTEGAMDNSSSVSAELRQPLLAGAGPAAAFYTYRTAQIARAASAGDLDRQGQSTVFQVRKLYWSAIQNQASLQANRRALASADYFLKATQAREEAGQASKLDVSNAQIQRSSREVALNLAESALENSLDDLKTALDLPLGECR